MALRKIIFLLFFWLTTYYNSYSQDKFGIGASGIYNFQTNEIGAGLRVEFPIYRRLTAVPQVMYFPTFNRVHEFFGGINLHYPIYTFRNWKLYAIAGGSANYWFNYSASKYPKAKAFNVIAELGAGIIHGTRSFRPFIEYRYNPVWKEGSIHVGVMFFPKGRSHGTCPAYK